MNENEKGWMNLSKRKEKQTKLKWYGCVFAIQFCQS